MANKLVSLVVNVPANREPSDMVTFAVAIKAPAGALSAIVALAGDSVIAVGVGAPASTGGVVPMFDQVAPDQRYQSPYALLKA